ncbi:glucose-1-phosphate adenylyltransferase [Nocardioidaceae bacterium]|nr:glucose-1-phosphate adenylyltransferase [Nocardioidaceae bacterium]
MSSPGTRRNVLAIVLAGGEGKRMMPLTMERAKAAVPFGGMYRLIDFALSNVVNSGFLKVVVLTQYKSHSLDRHITTTWRMSTMLGNHVTPVPAQQRTGKRWFAGSADAIFQSLNLLDDERPDLVLVVGADHVYRMDFAAMVEHHVSSGLPCTVAAIRQPVGNVGRLGVITPGEDGVIAEFTEKPSRVTGLPDARHQVLASMGNYVFDADVLREAVCRDAEDHDSSHEMGADVLPRLVAEGRAGWYSFSDNDVPGATDRDAGYWADMSTLRSYYESHMDLVGPDSVLNLHNRDWPLHTRYGPLPPAKVTTGEDGTESRVSASLLAPGCVVAGATVHHSVLSTGVVVESGAEVTDAVLLPGVRVGAGAVVRSAIIDKSVAVPAGVSIGLSQDADRRRGFAVDDGLTVIAKGQHVPTDAELDAVEDDEDF